jgi:hypothetical protein
MTTPSLILDANEVNFLAARLRRLFAHHGYALPDLARDDASLIRIAGSCIGTVLTDAAAGVKGGHHQTFSQKTPVDGR